MKIKTKFSSSSIRQEFLEFMKKRGHKIVPSASLLPENDPTTLFTGSGMQPMVRYLLGEKYPGGVKRIANVQKCFRSGDIEEVGDNRHTTFFEMLGNWSLGDYFKQEQIEWIFEFLTKKLELDPQRLYVSVYRGNEKLGLPKEEEAVKIWQKQFQKVEIEAKSVDLIDLKQKGVDLKGKCLVDLDNRNRIFYYSDSENWWSRAGAPHKMPLGEPGGPDSEIFWDFGPEHKFHENSPWKDQPCHPACECGRFMEIGNSVFMQYKKTENGFEELKQKNIDFGGGLERMTAAVLDNPDIFLTDLFQLPMKKLDTILWSQKNAEQTQKNTEKVTGYKESFYVGDDENIKQSFRVILDHIKGATFLINDGALPSNKDQGYFTRRLIRRAVRFGHQLGIKENFTSQIAEEVIKTYEDYYKDLGENRDKILGALEEEEKKFRKTLVKGLKKMEAIFDTTPRVVKNKGEAIRIVTGYHAFDLYQTYGFPIEMFIEELDKTGIEYDIKEIKKSFQEELQKHKDLSRTASAGKFKGGLADNDEATTQLHTITHLMLAGLRKVLGEEVSQKGSNITPERIRFDFSYSQAMTEEQRKAVEDFVNNALKTGGKVEIAEMPKQQAIDEGVTGAFWEKYPEQVKVYTITSPQGEIYSRELCGGPHVKNLSEIKGTFKILKEKSSGAGIRRIKAVLK